MLSTSRTALFLLFLSPLYLGCCLSWPFSGAMSLTGDARAAGQRYWETGLKRCGDSYYGKYSYTSFIIRPTRNNNLYQFKNLAFEVKAETLNDADKLNGIDWKGKSLLTYDAWRSYSYDFEKWNEWVSGRPLLEGPPVVADLRKQKGQWIVGNGSSSKAPYEQIDCSDIPK